MNIVAPSTSRSTSVAERCPFSAGQLLPADRLNTRPTMVLTGASRGIGHATVKLFSEAGWRIITCSRHPFERERCPWDAGAEDHVEVDLGDREAVVQAIKGIKGIKVRLDGGPLHALINNAGISPKAEDGS